MRFHEISVMPCLWILWWDQSIRASPVSLDIKIIKSTDIFAGSLWAKLATTRRYRSQLRKAHEIRSFRLFRSDSLNWSLICFERIDSSQFSLIQSVQVFKIRTVPRMCFFFFGRMTVVLRLSPSGGGTGNLQSGDCCCRTSTWQGGLSAWENDCNMLTYVASCCILRSLKENKKSSESFVADYRPGSQCHANELKTNLEMCHMLHVLYQYVTFIQHKRPHKRDDHIIWPS